VSTIECIHIWAENAYSSVQRQTISQPYFQPIDELFDLIV